MGRMKLGTISQVVLSLIYEGTLTLIAAIHYRWNQILPYEAALLWFYSIHQNVFFLGLFS